MFPSKGGFIGVIFEVKNPESGNLLTLDAFKEVQKFQNELFEIEYEYENGNSAKFKFDDICVKIGQPGQQFCLFGESPLTFAQNQFGVIDFTQFTSDSDLLTKVQSGTGGRSNGNGDIIEIDQIFGGTVPEAVTQDSQTGQNDLS
jgi:hypothetical protein